MTDSTLLLGALTTHKLIGREAELQAIEAIITPAPAESFQCLILEAAGGMGKTRLLREVYDRLTVGVSTNPDKGIWQRNNHIVLELIDLANVSLHPVAGFLREVRQRFESALPEAKAWFSNFDPAWLDYEEARDGDLGYAEVEKRATKLRDAFEQDYEVLTSQLRVVWLLDTLEQLFSVPREISEYLAVLKIDSEDLGLTTYAWLLNFIGNGPSNTSLLLAGRPEPSLWISDVRSRLPENAQPSLLVANFTETETGLYLQRLCDQLEQLPNFYERAQDLRVATNEPHEVANLHRLTGGNPIRLALYIDLFFNADVLPEPLSNPLHTEGLNDEAIRKLQDQLDTDLLDYLTKRLTEPEPQVLEYLSVMRRGLDRSRLRMLSGTDDRAIDEVFDSLQRFSFIKVRGDTLFLHDEFYSIYQRYLSRQEPADQEIERERQRRFFQRLIAFNRQRAEEIVKDIYAVQAELNELNKDDPSYLQTKERFRALRSERRQVRIERVHYALYNDPKMGLNDDFFRVAGQAFLANEPDIDELLQSEVTTFFFGGGKDLNRQQTGLSEADWQLLRFQVVHERVARWIRRLILRIQRQSAQQLARRATENHRTLISHIYPDLAPLYDRPDGALIEEMFKHEWAACRCFAAIFDGRELRGPIEELKQLEDSFKRTLSNNGLLRTELKNFRWRLLNILAECLLFRGFTHANLYEFKTAEEIYKQANQILDKTGFKTLQSDVKNNLARVLGERGNLYEALALCEEALEHRERYGFDLLRGLSRNTLALIHTRNARPTRANEHATSALTLFRQLGNPRGIGLALIQIAEAKRRMWNLKADEIRDDPLARIRIDRTLLDEVVPISEEAEQLFGQEFRSEARLAEIWIERASLYRDWATFFGLPEAAPQLELAREWYTKAQALAAENNYRYRQHYLATCINLAYVHTFAGEIDEALRMADTARNFVDQAYQFSKTSSVDTTAGDVTNFRELSKLHALYAEKLLPNENREDRLREYIFAVTAMQLFSPYEPYYLGVNERQMTSFITSTFKTLAEKQQLRTLTEQIVADYHLNALAPPLKSLRARELVDEAIGKQEEEPDYLKD